MLCPVSTMQDDFIGPRCITYLRTLHKKLGPQCGRIICQPVLESTSTCFHCHVLCLSTPLKCSECVIGAVDFNLICCHSFNAG